MEEIDVKNVSIFMNRVFYVCVRVFKRGVVEWSTSILIKIPFRRINLSKFRTNRIMNNIFFFFFPFFSFFFFF